MMLHEGDGFSIQILDGDLRADHLGSKLGHTFPDDRTEDEYTLILFKGMHEAQRWGLTPTTRRYRVDVEIDFTCDYDDVKASTVGTLSVEVTATDAGDASSIVEDLFDSIKVAEVYVDMVSDV